MRSRSPIASFNALSSPGASPAQFVGRQREDGLDTLPARAAEATRSTLIADIPFPALETSQPSGARAKNDSAATVSLSASAASDSRARLASSTARSGGLLPSALTGENAPAAGALPAGSRGPRRRGTTDIDGRLHSWSQGAWRIRYPRPSAA